jgi:site-specific DNA-cytosine methylase
LLNAPAGAGGALPADGTWEEVVNYTTTPKAANHVYEYAPAPEVKLTELTSAEALARVVDVLQKPAVVCDFCRKPACDGQMLSPGSAPAGTPATLRQMIDHMMEKIMNLPETAAKMAAMSGRRVRIGTMCSGTDSPILAMQAIAASMDKRGLRLEVEHSFSCEIDKDKQTFLKKNFTMGALFNDVCELGQEMAKDVQSGKQVPVPSGLDVLLAGFSCKDLSGMNTNRKKLEEMGTSGTTLQGCLDYIFRYRPKTVIFENVRNIAARDSETGLRQIDVVMEALRRSGYNAGWKFIDTKSYYLPQSRARVWMWGYRTGAAPHGDCPKVNELSAELVRSSGAQEPSAELNELNGKVHKILEHLQQDAQIHFDDLLLPEDDPYVQKDISNRVGRDANTVRVEKKAKLTWDVKHEQHRESLRNRYSKPYTSYRGAPWLRTLNERERQLCDINFQEVYEERGIDARQVPMLWEMSQSAGRVPGTKSAKATMHCAPCIVPGNLWHTTRRRFLLGREKLRYQGIFGEDLRDLDCVSETVLGDLAGNAFSATVCAANLLAAMLSTDP